MFTPLDWMVHLEASRMSLSLSGQRRYALLAALKDKSDKRKTKAAPKQSAHAGDAPVPCCQPAAA